VQPGGVGGLLSHLAAHTGRLLLAVIPSYMPPNARAGSADRQA
jgi:hypothetical protein